MIYPIRTIFKYLFGNRGAATELLSNLTPKRMIEFHALNLIIASIFTFFISSILSKRIISEGNYSELIEFLNISTINVFKAYLPIIFGGYIFLLISIFLLSIIYQIVSLLFKSNISFKTTFSALQFLTIFHPIFHLFFLTLILINNPIILGIFFLLVYSLGFVLFFTLSKQYAQIAGLTTITIIFLNLIIISIIFGSIYLMISSIMGSVPAI